MIATDRPALSLAELEAFDAHPSGHGAEKRFCCPLPGCRDKSVDRGHQSLCVNVDTGLWLCNRCQATGKLTERWETGAGGARGRRREACRHVFRLPEEPRPGRAASAPYLEPLLARAAPVAGTPGERYLAGRGIPVAVATAAGVRYTGDCYGRPGVLFPVRDQGGALVAAIVRHTDGRDDPKVHSVGDRSLGVFATPGALGGGPLVVAEGPVDALALAALGVPAVAIGTTRAPRWLRVVAAFREVLLGLDADAAGDEGAAVLLAELTPFAASVRRMRPRVGKDWNDWLQADASSLRRALTRLASTAASTATSASTGDADGDADGDRRAPLATSAGAVTLVQAFELWAGLEAAAPAGGPETATAGRFYRLVEVAGIATDAGPEDDVGPYLEGLAAGENGEGVAALLAAGRALLAGAGACLVSKQTQRAEVAA